MTMLGQGAAITSTMQALGETPGADRPSRVMIVDDSAVVRGLVSRWIGEEPGIEVVARHANGKLAVGDVAGERSRHRRARYRDAGDVRARSAAALAAGQAGGRVLIASTLTRHNAEISFKALSLGALDYVLKPDSNRELTLSADFREELIRKLKGPGPAAPPGLAREFGAEGAPLAPDRAEPQIDLAAGRFRHRRFSLVPPRIIAIGSSTGGPQAFTEMLEPLAMRGGRP